MNVSVIKGGQLSLWASVIAHCGALVLMCLFCCKQLFFHFLILMLTRKCVIFGFHSLCFTECFFSPQLNMEKEREDKASENGHRLIMALKNLFPTYSYTMLSTVTRVDLLYLRTAQ